MRKLGAGLLAAVAIAGLAALPVLHAESHAGLEARAKAEARQIAFALAFLPHRTRAQESALRRATALAFSDGEDTHQGEPAPQHAHDGAPVHSHGGLGHGEGALEHLGLALADAAPPAAVAPPLAARAVDSPAPQSAPQVVRYLVPRFAQGPPRG